MALISPQKIHVVPRTVVGTSEFDFQYTENDGLGITQHGRLSKLFFGTEVIPPGGSASVRIEHYAPTQEKIGEFLKIQRLVNTCVNNAEDIKRELHTVVAWIFRKKPELVNASATYDFMKLKDTFTDYMKKDDITRSLANKEFRRDFNQFIIDRNTYTHGKLMVRHGDNDFVLSYKDNNTKIQTYAVVDFDTIRSYYTTYTAIRQLIRDFHTLTNVVA